MNTGKIYVPEKQALIKKHLRKLTKAGKKKTAKYRNKKCEALGKKFDSVKERDRYLFLLDAQQRGEIMQLECQKRYRIEVSAEFICDYYADFFYYKIKGFLHDEMKIARGGKVMEGYRVVEPVVEDVKSEATAKLPVFALKRKLMKAVFGIEIRIVESSTLPI